MVIRKQLFGGERKDTDSTRDQDEGFTTVKTRQKKKFVLPMTSSQKEDRGEDMLVDKEAGTRGLSKKTAGKRPRDTEEDDEDTCYEDTCYEDAEEVDSSFISNFLQMLEDRGAGHMFGPIRDRFQQFVANLLKKQVTKIKAERVDIKRTEKDME